MTVFLKFFWQTFTWDATMNSGIFVMFTIMFSPFTMTTSSEGFLNSNTSDVIQPYLSSTIWNVTTLKSSLRSWEAKLSTNYFGIIQVPGVVAYCSPFAVVKYFYTSNTRFSEWSLQPDWYFYRVESNWVVFYLAFFIYIHKSLHFVFIINQDVGVFHYVDAPLKC